MSTRAVFFVSGGGYEAAWQATSLGITAVAMGDEVIFVVAFDALRALAQGAFGRAVDDRERAEVARGDGLGAPRPARLLAEARSLGLRLVACDTTVKLCGLVPEDLEARRVVDEVVGAPQIWRLTQGARVLSF